MLGDLYSALRLRRVLSSGYHAMFSRLAKLAGHQCAGDQQSTEAARIKHRALIELAYRVLLFRDVEPNVLEDRVAALSRGLPFSMMFEEIANSDEARNALLQQKRSFDPGIDSREEARTPLLIKAIETIYMHFLGRKPEVEELGAWLGQLRDGMTVEAFLDNVSRGEEARARGGHDQIGPGLSDGEFMLVAAKLLFGRGLLPLEIVAWQRRLETSGETRPEVVTAILQDRIREASRLDGNAPHVHNPDLCAIMGTTQILTRKDWNDRERELGIESSKPPSPVPLEERHFSHSGAYAVSMIASLYRGGRFIESFLDNITAQTYFDRSELIIIEADSPDNEWQTIERYQEIYPNIVYRRINYRLGIYDAWNVGIELSRGAYLTNTNLDDLRRSDSTALQATFLNKHLDIDIVYQNFFYSFNADLDFEQVASCNFRSALPILTPHNFLMFNSPHNAPMWRKALHAELGAFDTYYRSAGDYEFWARCLAGGKQFGKIDDPHVVYFQNPDGISTRPDTRGIKEAHDILTRYGKALTAPALLQSRRDFLVNVGSTSLSDGLDSRAYYDVVQDELIKLGVQR